MKDQWSIQNIPNSEFQARMNPKVMMHSQYNGSNTPSGPTGQLPCQTNSRLSEARSPHPGGCHFLFGDGTVRFISENVDQKVYVAQFTIAGGEILSGDSF